MNQSLNEPQLQAPGAGLPLLQKLFLKLFIGPIVSKRQSLEIVRHKYTEVTEKMIKIASQFTEKERNQKILVPSQPGLEDSSRYWSINGTLEHIMIVSSQVKPVILLLANQEKPTQIADVAKVKPTHLLTDVLSQFQKLAPNLLSSIDQEILERKLNLNSSTTHFHPWFGEFKARQWYWLLNAHQLIHYQQLKEIAKRIKK